MDPNEKFNPPDSGIYVRNPSHVIEAKNAEDQREIVNAIREIRASHMKAIYDYSTYDPKIPSTFPGLPGLLKLRTMTENEIRGFCATLMRTKPNITGMHLYLGKEYTTKKEYSGIRVNALKSNKPRNPTEIAADMAALLSDKSLCVIEIQYIVNAASPGNFNTDAKVFVCSAEEYADDKKFCPYLEVEFFSI
jgi:hypothetical protein